MSLNLNPMRATSEVQKVIVYGTVGASGAHTVTVGKGVASTGIAKGTTGKYTVTFTDVAAGTLLDIQVRYSRAADAEPIVARGTVATYSATAKTVAYEVWKLDGSSAVEEPASGDTFYLEATFIKTA